MINFIIIENPSEGYKGYTLNEYISNPIIVQQYKPDGKRSSFSDAAEIVDYIRSTNDTVLVAEFEAGVLTLDDKEFNRTFKVTRKELQEFEREIDSADSRTETYSEIVEVVEDLVFENGVASINFDPLLLDSYKIDSGLEDVLTVVFDAAN